MDKHYEFRERLSEQKRVEKCQGGSDEHASTAGDINERSCASQQNGMLDVRFGSLADIAQCRFDVRFTPKSGHRNRLVSASTQQLRQLGDARRDPSCGIAGQ
jgi:hypothetical protein